MKVYLFVLFVCDDEIYQTTISTIMLLIPPLWRVHVCQGALVLFRPTVQELLTIDQLFQRKLLATQATIVYNKF
jgi:hypothetical protein